MEWFFRLFSMLWDRDSLQASYQLKQKRGQGPRGAWKCPRKYWYHWPWWD
jgi:hypothetical protein